LVSNDPRDKPSVQHELSRRTLNQLDATLAQLYSQLSPGLSSRIAKLVNEALPSGIHPDRLVKYAFLYATAEGQAQGDAVSKDHTVRAKHELAGEIHGLPTGYRDLTEAKRRYRMGRRARQQIQASLESVLGRWQSFEQVVQGHRSELPVHLRSRFSNEALRTLAMAFQRMEIVLALEEDIVGEKPERELSAIGQTYMWWCLVMAPYRGRWNDMHQLAVTWRMASTDSVKKFRTRLSRMCKGTLWTYPFSESWKSALSKQ
jgi:hypothetical protein